MKSNAAIVLCERLDEGSAQNRFYSLLDTWMGDNRHLMKGHPSEGNGWKHKAVEWAKSQMTPAGRKAVDEHPEWVEGFHNA